VIALARPRSNSPVNYRPVFSSERTHCKQNDVIVQRTKSKIKSGQGSQKEARYPDLLVDWLSAARRTPTPTPTPAYDNPALCEEFFEHSSTENVDTKRKVITPGNKP
jgi:hypothetical protein